MMLKEINCITILMRLQKDIGSIVCTVYHQCAIVLEMANILVCSPCSPPPIFFIYLNYFNFKIIYSSIVVKEEAILICHFPLPLKKNAVKSESFDSISRKETYGILNLWWNAVNTEKWIKVFWYKLASWVCNTNLCFYLNSDTHVVDWLRDVIVMWEKRRLKQHLTRKIIVSLYSE